MATSSTAVRSSLAAANSADLRRLHAEKQCELVHPLFEQRPPMDQYQRVGPAGGHDACAQHRLSGTRRSYQDANVVREGSPDGVILLGREGA
jgi:hypothetical protein